MRLHLFAIFASAVSFLFFTGASFASVDRDIWLKDLGVDMEQSMCAGSSYFRRCFSASPDECVNTVRKNHALCSARYRKSIPKQIGESDFESWRMKLKACLGVSTSIALEDAKKAVGSEACDPQNDKSSETNAPIPTEIYLEQAVLSLPQDLCFSGMPHRTCYSVSESQCRRGAAKAISECIPELKKSMPSSVRLSENRGWDMEIVECLSPRFDQIFASQRQKKEEFCRTAISSLRDKRKVKAASKRPVR